MTSCWPPRQSVWPAPVWGPGRAPAHTQIHQHHALGSWASTNMITFCWVLDPESEDLYHFSEFRSNISSNFGFSSSWQDSKTRRPTKVKTWQTARRCKIKGEDHGQTRTGFGQSNHTFQNKAAAASGHGRKCQRRTARLVLTEPNLTSVKILWPIL